MNGPCHLLYHVYPLKAGEDFVAWNIEQLLKRSHRFTGRKFVGVATGPETHPFECTRDLFPTDWEVVEVENDRMKRETTTWHRGWPTLEKLGGQVFFAHTKGVTRYNKDYGDCAIKWSEIMYHTLLDFPLETAAKLKRYQLLGSFKKKIMGFDPESKSPWHYHGAFYWVRWDLFKEWRSILPKWFAVESWPGDVLPDYNQAGTMFMEGGSSMNMYERGFCDTAWQEMLKWEATTLDFIEARKLGPVSTTPSPQS